MKPWLRWGVVSSKATVKTMAKDKTKNRGHEPEPKEEGWEDLFESSTVDGFELATEDTYLDAYKQETRDNDVQQVISFWMGPEEYALDLLEVKEILRYQPPTCVPRTKPFILGVISVRGEVLPVLDLMARMGLGHSKANDTTRILVVEREGERYGLTVDSISGVEELTTDHVEPPPPAMKGQEDDFLSGIGRIGSRMLILIQLSTVLSFEAALALEAT